MMKIHEVAARDGLQNESTIFSTEQKMRLLELLAQTKPDSLEVTSFVRADRVPQFADAIELCHRLKSRLLYISPSPRDQRGHRTPSSA